MKKTWSDWLSKPLAELLTSTLFVILVMITFMVGIVTHLAVVFDSWFLASGFQCVVVIASVNSEILPKFTIKKEWNRELKKDVSVKTLPAIAMIMSIFMLFFISISFGLIDHAKSGDWTSFTIALVKAFATAAMELMFSYLFTSRWNTDLKRFVGLKTDFEKLLDKQLDEDEIAELKRLRHQFAMKQEFKDVEQVQEHVSTITSNTQIKKTEEIKHNPEVPSDVKDGYL